MKKNIVCLGGGNGMPKVVLAGLKKYPVKIFAVCAMLDSGGSAGRLRKDYKIVSPGDIRRAFLALANISPIIESFFNYRFQSGGLKNHNFANLFITALELTTNSHEKTSQIIKQFLNVKHEVYPVTLDNSELCVVLENGKIIKGETNIDIPKHNGDLKIKKVYLKPKAQAYPKAIEAIKNANLIVIGPGDLYSSIAQILLTDGISQAIKQSKAKKIYICNLMTKYGETNDFSVLKFTNEIEKYLKTELDYVIYNNFLPSKNIIAKYKKNHSELLNLVKIDNELIKSKSNTKTKLNNSAKFIAKNLLKKNSIEHDTRKIAKILFKLV